MNELVLKQTAIQTGISINQIIAVNKMLEEGNTIPFIARYRKEATGGLDENQIKAIGDVFAYEQNLQQRKEDVIRLIEEKQMMTPDLKTKILGCVKLVDIEDLYRPYKEKKKTKATEAIALGLEPLAKQIFSQKESDIEALAAKHLNDKVKTVSLALEQAAYIISEWISDNASFRRWIRTETIKNGNVVSKVKKNAPDPEKTYEMYYDFKEPVKQIKGHRVLALSRAEKEKVVSFKIEVDTKPIFKYLEEKNIITTNPTYARYLSKAIEDAYDRLISPSIEREIWSELEEKASDGAINLFSKNLAQLLMTQPVKGKTVLGFDPAFRTGCKLAVIDQQGKMLDIKVIYPHQPVNKVQEAKQILTALIKKYNINVIAIGNGTASRESEEFVANVLKELNDNVAYTIVNEAGASVYSASKEAQKEFPDLQVEERSAISIARRLQEPLAELIKIDPKSIGVGQYQHDVDQKKLGQELDFVVSSVVNNVGVNINTASTELLEHVSGITKTIASNIIEARGELGKFNSRVELKKVKGLGPKAFEQAAGFLRILDGKNPLDKTPIHPESYDKAKLLMEKLGISVDKLGTSEVIEKVDSINPSIATELGIDKYTFEDLVKSFKKPLQDPRDDVDAPIFKNDVVKLEDLKPGMELDGIVRNITDFGAFIDIGLKNDGMAHISKLKKGFVKHPMDVVSVGQKVTCYVVEVFKDKGKVSLSLIKD